MALPGRRGAAALFSDLLVRRLAPGLWGEVFPPRAPPPLPVDDARYLALVALGDYLAEIVFQIPEPPGPPKPYRLARERIYEEWPDSPQERLFPSIEFLPGVAELRPPGLTPSANEASADVFGPGTVLVPQHEHVERVTIEVEATTRSMRRFLVAGIEAMLQPSEGVGALRLRTAHYGQVARFTLLEQQTVDEADSARRRRRSNLVVELSTDVVRLVNVSRIRDASAEVSVVPSQVPLPPPTTVRDR